MSALNDFKNSNAWDHIHDLPLVPRLNNPWIYMAYAFKLIFETDGIILTNSNYNLDNYIRLCEKQPGLFNRWPDETGGSLSQDEVVGISCISIQATARLRSYLLTHLGDYNNSNQFNFLGRFYWLYAILNKSAFGKAGFINQLLWTIMIIFDTLTYRNGDASGRLLIWAMLDLMDGYKIPNYFINKWKNKMKRIGMTPKLAFQQELPDYPVFEQYAPEEF